MPLIRFDSYFIGDRISFLENETALPGQGAYSTPVLTIGTGNLLHGSNVTLWISVAQKDDAVVVPLNAVVFRDRNPYVFVANPDTGKVEQRQVKLGIEGLDRREIIEGVSPGELLVTEGQNRLVDGATVKVMQSQLRSSREDYLSQSRRGAEEEAKGIGLYLNDIKYGEVQ